MAVNETQYEIVWPRGRRAVGIIRPADRLASLEGKTIAALWNWLFRGNEVLPAAGKELQKRYPGLRFIGHEVFGSTHGKNEVEMLAALPAKLKENRCDAVISGVGC